MTQEVREITPEAPPVMTADPRTARMRQTVAELVAIERALVAAYRWAAGRSEVIFERDKLRDFGRAHEAQLAELERFAGAVQAATVTHDLAVDELLRPLNAILEHEDAAARAYEEALQHPIDLPLLRDAMHEALERSRQRWAWLTLHAEPPESQRVG
jgi:hypothetical protein